MLTPPRFVVLDDKPEHLIPIVEAFKNIGTACIGIPYNEEDGSHLDLDYYRGVRGFFIDLHLSGGSSIGSNFHYAEIVNILERVITLNNGPFIMVLWSENDQECDDLTQYIEERLAEDKKYCKPLLIKSLSKTDYICFNPSEPDFGNIKSEKREEFKIKIKEFFTSIPQIAALFDWESKVLEAVNQTLIELMNLVPSDKRNFSDYPEEIDKVLSCITRDTVGRSHVSTDPKKAFNLAIAPILVDKVLNNQTTSDNIQLWNDAITQVNSATISDVKSVGKFNKMLHLAVTGHETMGAYDWGAVVEIPSQIFTDDYCRENLGLSSKKELGKQIFGFRDLEGLKPILVRIGASCDYAQNKKGPISYIFGYIVSHTKYNCRQDDFDNPAEKSFNKRLSDWSSPLFYYEGAGSPFYIVLNLQLVITTVKDKLAGYETLYRIREQLLNQIILRTTTFASRPGITELYVPRS